MNISAFALIWRMDFETSTHKLIMLTLARWAGEGGLVRTRKAQIAKSACCHPKTVQRLLIDLEKSGHVRVHPQAVGDGRVVMSIYQLTLSGQIDTTEDVDLVDAEVLQKIASLDILSAGGRILHPQTGLSVPQSGPTTPPSVDSSVDSSVEEMRMDKMSSARSEAVAIWNEMAKANRLAEVTKLTEKRKRRLDDRLKSAGIDGWRLAVGRVAGSKWMCEGSASRPNWRATFDFLVQEDQFQKLLEGAVVQDRRPKGAAVSAAEAEVDARARDDLLADERFQMSVVETWRQDHGKWPAAYGPPPDAPGCIIPVRVLHLMGVATPAPSEPAEADEPDFFA